MTLRSMPFVGRSFLTRFQKRSRMLALDRFSEAIQSGVGVGDTDVSFWPNSKMRTEQV
jgi:hypothetical protein